MTKRWRRKWRQVFRSLRHRLRPGAVILRYHRIADLSSDPHPVCVSPARFAEHLEVLKKHRRIISLRQLIGEIQNGHIPSGTVVLTLDDGYADNLYQAKPLLERFDVPATVFVTTGHLRLGREFWWDELEQVLLQPRTLPNALSLTVDGARHEWDLGDACHYSQEDFRRHRSWNLRLDHDPSPRHRLYRALHKLLKPMSSGEQQRILDDLWAWAGLRPSARETHRFLTPDEIIRMAAGGLIEIGAHTVTHPILSQLPAALQRDEILGSKTHLEDILGSPVISFAYPYGSRYDYTKETAAIIQEAGFDCACSTVADMIFETADRFELPRIYVGNWPHAEFAQTMGFAV